MANISLRDCDDELKRALKRRSAEKGMSVNRLILDILRNALLGNTRKPRRHEDLDALAGTWTTEEAAAFDRAVSEFGEIDETQWRADCVAEDPEDGEQ